MSITASVIYISIGVLLFLLPFLLRRFDRDKIKDALDIYTSTSKILAAIAIPLIIFTVGSKIQVETASINQKIDWQRHDLSVLQEFQKTYADENTRGLSLRYLKLLKDEKTQTETRTFVMWDLLRQIIKKQANLGHKFKFDENDDNGYYLAQNLNEWYAINTNSQQTIVDLVNRLIHDGPAIYKNYSSEQQFNLFLSCLSQRLNFQNKLARNNQ